MGSPAAFPESNAVWKGWPAAVGRPEVLDLPSYRQGAETITCWEFTPEEIVEIISTGHVWLHVVGQQPCRSTSAGRRRFPIRRKGGPRYRPGAMSVDPPRTD